MNDSNRCVACDIRLKGAESYMCSACGAEHDAGYAANLAAERARLLALLKGDAK